jgi:hypothetical protein
MTTFASMIAIVTVGIPAAILLLQSGFIQDQRRADRRSAARPGRGRREADLATA